MRRAFLIYVVILMSCGAGIYGALERGKRLETARAAASPAAPSISADAGGRGRGALENLSHPLPRLLLQLITIVLAARLLGALMELIALNVGYELGILSPRIFAMMVLMAIATTFATAPLLSLADRWRVSSPSTGPREAAEVGGSLQS